ncbi:MAG: manganese efflux pump [Acetatifactor muris]|nr:manganese efflux pump [Acetatifactor muris]
MFFSSLLFGISASLDALLVGISYGIRSICIRFWQNLTISLITLLGTCLSVGLGHRLVHFFPGTIGNYAGSVILILLGLYYIVKWAFFLMKTLHTAEKTAGQESSDDTPVDGSSGQTLSDNASAGGSAVHKFPPVLTLTEVLTLSLTLSLNNLSAGLSASLAGLTLVPAGISTFVCSVLFLSGGNRLGQNPVLQLAGRAAEPLSGALLISLGVIQFFF